MSEVARLGLLILLLLGPVLSARAQKPVEEETQPSQELLEFLGEWTTDNDELLAPADLEKMQLPAEEYDHENQ